MHIKDYTYHNSFACITLHLRLLENFHEALSHVKIQMEQFKHSVIPAGIYLFLKYLCSFAPIQYINAVSRSTGTRHTLVFSNVPGYIKPVKYGGALAKRFFYCGTAPGNLATTVTIVSILKRA